MKLSFRLAALLLAAGAAAAFAQAQQQPPRKKASKPAAAASAAAQPASAAASTAQARRDPEKENAGRLAAQGWLLLLDRRDWGTAWDASSAMFRQTVPLGNWMDAIPKVREPFGALVERTPADTVYKTSLPGHPDGDYVSVIFVSKFEKKDEVQEVVTTVREPDGRWRVTGYSAR